MFSDVTSHSTSHRNITQCTLHQQRKQNVCTRPNSKTHTLQCAMLSSIVFQHHTTNKTISITNTFEPSNGIVIIVIVIVIIIGHRCSRSLAIRRNQNGPSERYVVIEHTISGPDAGRQRIRIHRSTHRAQSGRGLCDWNLWVRKRVRACRTQKGAGTDAGQRMCAGAESGDSCIINQ